MLKQEEQKASKCRKSGNIASIQRRIGQENRGDKKRTEILYLARLGNKR